MDKELWRQICGFEGTYEISNTGRMRRVAPGNGTRPGRINKPATDRDGYQKYTLSRDSKSHFRFAHRLMYEAFVGPIPNGIQINHKNGAKSDNRLDNLELMTPAENTRHGFRVLGRKAVLNPQKGTANGRAKINEKTVQEIFQLRSLGWSQQRIADLFGINQTNVSGILRGVFWKHVS